MIGEFPSLVLLNKSGWRQVSEEPLHHGAPGPHVWKGHRLCSRVIAVNSPYTSLLQPCVHSDGKPPPWASQMTTYCSP